MTLLKCGSLMTNRIRNAAHVAMLGLLCGWFCSGCNKGVAVPSDCQRFLDKYFEAVQSRDVGKLQELSFSDSQLQLEPPRGTPPDVVNRMHEEQRKISEEGFDHVSKMFGDFKSYSVMSVKVSPVTAADLEAAKMQGAADFLEGTHAEIICKVKFSRLSGLLQLNLIKKTQDSEYLFQAYRYQAE
jgi:hypothetical protein